jgi:hypothetical protein
MRVEPKLSDRDKEQIKKAVLIALGTAIATAAGELLGEALRRWFFPEPPSVDPPDDEDEDEDDEEEE